MHHELVLVDEAHTRELLDDGDAAIQAHPLLGLRLQALHLRRHDVPIDLGTLPLGGLQRLGVDDRSHGVEALADRSFHRWGLWVVRQGPAAYESLVALP